MCWQQMVSRRHKRVLMGQMVMLVPLTLMEGQAAALPSHLSGDWAHRKKNIEGIQLCRDNAVTLISHGWSSLTRTKPADCVGIAPTTGMGHRGHGN
eukprot:superscaffoldBa00000267_g3332